MLIGAIGNPAINGIRPTRRRAHLFRPSVQPAINDPDIMGMALPFKVDSQGSIESGTAKNNV
jgi:hypothetical protein